MTVARRGFLGLVGASTLAFFVKRPAFPSVADRLHAAADRMRSRKLYRTTAGGTQIKMIASINDNTTTYTD